MLMLTGAIYSLSQQEVQGKKEKAGKIITEPADRGEYLSPGFGSTITVPEHV